MKHAIGRIRAVPNAAQNRGRRFKTIWAALALALVCGAVGAAAQDAEAPPTFKAEEIDQLVAPIALYPDSLIAQILMASTYPLEVVEAARWSKDNPDVKDKALEDAMQKQTWDPSVKSLTAFPQVLTMMNEDLAWTQKLGDAFLAQQSDVLDGVQRLRAKAKEEGNLETTKEQKVIVEQAPAPPANVEQNVNVEAAPAPQTVIKIEPADPQVVYVPTYNPTVVYGTWPYPSYPPYSYYPPGYVAATSMLSFGIGMAAGAALWGDCNWGGYGGHNDVDIDVNNYNNFNRTDIKNGNWEHNSDHRKGVQYRDNKTQQKYGRGQSNAAKSREQFRGRADSGRKDLAGAGGDKARRDVDRANRQGAGQTKRDAGKDRASTAQRDAARQRSGATSRDAGQQRASSDRAASAKRDAGQNRSSTANRDAARQQSANRQAQQRQSSQQRTRQASSDRNAGAYRGMDSGRNTRQYSDRGRSSRMGSSGGGRSGGHSGGARGGGGRGGGGRGGGGRR